MELYGLCIAHRVWWMVMTLTGKAGHADGQIDGRGTCRSRTVDEYFEKSTDICITFASCVGDVQNANKLFHFKLSEENRERKKNGAHVILGENIQFVWTMAHRILFRNAFERRGHTKLDVPNGTWNRSGKWCWETLVQQSTASTKNFELDKVKECVARARKNRSVRLATGLPHASGTVSQRLPLQLLQ